MKRTLLFGGEAGRFLSQTYISVYLSYFFVTLWAFKI